MNVAIICSAPCNQSPLVYPADLAWSFLPKKPFIIISSAIRTTPFELFAMYGSRNASDTASIIFILHIRTISCNDFRNPLHRSMHIPFKPFDDPAFAHYLHYLIKIRGIRTACQCDPQDHRHIADMAAR